MENKQIQIFKETDPNKGHVRFIVKVNGFIEEVFKTEPEAREYVEKYAEPVQELIYAKVI